MLRADKISFRADCFATSSSSFLQRLLHGIHVIFLIGAASGHVKCASHCSAASPAIFAMLNFNSFICRICRTKACLCTVGAAKAAALPCLHSIYMYDCMHTVRECSRCTCSRVQPAGPGFEVLHNFASRSGLQPPKPAALCAFTSRLCAHCSWR